MLKTDWEYTYIDNFKNLNKTIEPMNWKSFEYYFRLYIGAGKVSIKVKEGAILIERLKK